MSVELFFALCISVAVAANGGAIAFERWWGRRFERKMRSNQKKQ